MKLKKYLCTLFAALTALTLLLSSGCDFSSDGKLHIVCTIFPQYDWVRELTKGAQNVEVTLLEDSGADLHNFQPSAADKVSILNSDLFVYTGGESDDWARTLLENAEKDVRSLDLIEALRRAHLALRAERKSARFRHPRGALRRGRRQCRTLSEQRGVLSCRTFRPRRSV